MSTDTPVTPALVTTSTADRFTGRVKWFNTKTGYGFITVTDGDKSGSDVFVHHSAVIVSSEQYKYLVQGEYIEFTLIHTEGGTHEYQAGDVSGIKGGKLMCETRKEFRDTRTSYKGDEGDNVGEEEAQARVPRSVRPPQERRPQREARSQGEARTQGESQGDSWAYVANKKREDRPSAGGRGRGSGGRGAAGGGRGQGKPRESPKPRLEL